MSISKREWEEWKKLTEERAAMPEPLSLYEIDELQRAALARRPIWERPGFDLLLLVAFCGVIAITFAVWLFFFSHGGSNGY